jgi:hypothetical protein
MEWLPLLRSPALQRVESLCLRKLLVLDAVEWAATFHNLNALHSLHLRQCTCIDRMLAAMAANPEAFRSLRCLRISMEQLDADRRALLFGPCVPSADHLGPALAALPDLTALELELPPQPAPSADSAPAQPAAARSRLLAWPLVHERFLALQQAHLQRVRILIAQVGDSRG